MKQTFSAGYSTELADKNRKTEKISQKVIIL